MGKSFLVGGNSFENPDKYLPLVQAMEEGTLYYKLGQEATYKSYINQFTTNPYTLSKVQANEERVKRTHLSHKFSLTEAR